MPAAPVLNPRPSDAGEPELEPSELSQKILGVARGITSAAQRERLDALSSLLRRVDPAAIEGDGARLAFWINLYHALLLHGLSEKPVRGSMLRHLRLFSKIAYDVGEHRYTLNLIEHGVLRRNRRPPFHLRRVLRSGDPRLGAAPSRLDPRIHFALNCGARSCPPIRAYTPDEIDDQLEIATGSYLNAESEIEDRRVRLPRLLRLYAADFGGREEQLAFVSDYLPEVRAMRGDAKGSIQVKYRRFDWTAASGSENQ